MEFIPGSKNDLKAIQALDSMSNDAIYPYLNEIIAWVKDVNWPVAVPICERLASFDERIVPVIEEILSGQDEQWKYTVLSNLIPKLSPSVMELSMNQVVRIVNEPTESEIAESLNLVARDTIFVYSHSV